MNNPKLSVITPLFNGVAYIEETIKNVAAQNCDSVEHIIVDGQSTDDSLEIVQKYARQYPHIRWKSEKDDNPGEAMNKGIAMARGGIIGFVNDDDYYEPDVFARILKIFTGLPEPSIIVGNCNVWGNDGELIEVNTPNRLRLVDLVMEWDVTPTPCNPTAYFYHRSLHDVVGLYSTDDLLHDLEFLFRAVPAAHVKYFNETWGNFRLIHGTITTNAKERGEHYQLKCAVKRAAIDRLPPPQKFWIRLQIFFVMRWRYYRRDPDQILTAEKQKLGIKQLTSLLF